MLSLPLLSKSGRKVQRDKYLLVLYFCPCLSKTEYPELEESWKDGVKVTGIKTCFIFLFHFGGRIWKYLCKPALFGWCQQGAGDTFLYSLGGSEV